MIRRLNCPLSDHDAEVIFSRPYSLPELRPFAECSGAADQMMDKPYEVRFCMASGLYFQTWVLDDAEAIRYYTPRVEETSFVGEIGEQKLHWLAHMTEEILVMRQLLSAKVPIVLDFGCNWGKWASMALAHGCEVYGVDVNRAAAAFCANRGIKMISREEAKGMQFDFINVDQVLEHVTDPLGVARDMAACLKPGGFMKWGTPGDLKLPRLLRTAQANGETVLPDARKLDALAPLMHVNLFTNGALRFLANRVGLTPARLPFFKMLGAGQLWNIPRQFNHNLVTPWKRWGMRGTYLWFQKRAA